MSTMTRIAAALAVWAAGAVHLYLWDAEDYRSIHVIGVLFLLNGIAAALVGAALLFTAHPLVLLSGVCYAAATLAAFAVSATNGLFGFKEEWSGTTEAVAGIAELASLGLLLGLLASRTGSRAPPGRRGPAAGPPRESGGSRDVAPLGPTRHRRGPAPLPPRPRPGPG